MKAVLIVTDDKGEEVFSCTAHDQGELGNTFTIHCSPDKMTHGTTERLVEICASLAGVDLSDD
jgi:hypothetical protein